MIPRGIGVLLTAAFTNFASAATLEIKVENQSDTTSLIEVTIDPGDDPQKFSDNEGDFDFSADSDWLGDQAIVEAVILSKLEDDLSLSVTVTTYYCLKSRKCAARTITVPILPKFFYYKEVEKKCSSGNQTSNFQERITKYIYCREAYRFWQIRNLANPGAWPASSP